MKKLLAVILALAMVLGMTTAAFAADNNKAPFIVTPFGGAVKTLADNIFARAITRTVVGAAFAKTAFTRAVLKTAATVGAASLAIDTAAIGLTVHSIAKLVVDYPLIGIVPNFEDSDVDLPELAYDALLTGWVAGNITVNNISDFLLEVVGPDNFPEAVEIMLIMLNIYTDGTDYGDLEDALWDCLYDSYEILDNIEAEDCVLFNDDPFGLYTPFMTAKEGEWVYVKANKYITNWLPELKNLPNELESKSQNTPFYGVHLYKVVMETPFSPAIYKFQMPARIVSAYDFNNNFGGSFNH